MSLGDYNNNDNNKKRLNVNVYSAYTMSNSASEIDPSRLSFKFFNKLLQITIDPKTEGSTIEQPEYDEKKGISIYLSHTKARMLYNEICKFQSNEGGIDSAGVTSGSGLISISNGREYDVNSTCLTIQKLDENGSIESSYAYEFKKDYHYSIRNFNPETVEFDKIYYNDLEIEQLKSLLLSYYESMSCALAYSVIESNKYENAKIHNKLDGICDKLGVEYSSKKYNNKSSDSIFNNKEPRNREFQQGTIDDFLDD